jgi:hypothetical protein
LGKWRPGKDSGGRLNNAHGVFLLKTICRQISTSQSLNNNRVAKTADAAIAFKNLSQTTELRSKNAPRRPDDRNADDGGGQAEQAKTRRLLLRRLRHPAAHGLGEPRQEHTFDRKNKADRGSEITQFILPSAFQA